MIRFINLITFLLCFTPLFAQNVGQEGDTLLNYTDINGFKQGNWKKNYPGGNIQFEAYFVNDKPVGKLKRYDRFGNLYALLNYDEKGVKATAEFYHRSGKTAAKGFYYEKSKDSIWLYTDDNGKLYLQESYKQGVKHGLFIQYSSEGKKLEETSWVNGVKQGPWRKYFVNGQMMFEVNINQGKIDGPAKVYYANGKLHKEGKYVNDMMHGPWFVYNENGGLKKVYTYKDGVCPELQDESDAIIKQTEQEKDQFDDPAEHINDPNWFRDRSGR